MEVQEVTARGMRSAVEVMVTLLSLTGSPVEVRELSIEGLGSRGRRRRY